MTRIFTSLKSVQTSTSGIDLKGGLTWDNIRTRIATDDQYKKDLESSRVVFNWEGGLTIGNKTFDLTGHALSQLLSRFTPSAVRYFKRLLSDGTVTSYALARRCINYGIDSYVEPSRGGRKELLFRTRQLPNGKNIVRSVLTDRYQILDNHEILGGIVSKMSASMTPARLVISDTGFELMVIDRLLTEEVAKDDRNYIANFYKNSETGNGSFGYIIGVFRALCLNGMSLPVSTHGFRVSHVSKSDMNGAIEDGIYQSFVKAPSIFAKLKESTQIELPRQLVNPTIQMVSLDGKWTSEFESQVKAKAVTENPTKYGIIQAITHSAKSLSDEKFVETEAFAGKLLFSDFSHYIKQASQALPVG